MKKKRQKQLALFPSPSSWLLCGFDWYQGIHRVVMMSIAETQSWYCPAIEARATSCLQIYWYWSLVCCYLHWKAILMTHKGMRKEKSRNWSQAKHRVSPTFGGARCLACNVYSGNARCLGLIQRSQPGHVPRYSLHLLFFCLAIPFCSHPQEAYITASIIMTFYYHDLKP